jgi:hypothetical protein
MWKEKVLNSTSKDTMGVVYFEEDQTSPGAYNCTHRGRQYATWSSDNVSMKDVVAAASIKSTSLGLLLEFQSYLAN